MNEWMKIKIRVDFEAFELFRVTFWKIAFDHPIDQKSRVFHYNLFEKKKKIRCNTTDEKKKSHSLSIPYFFLSQ